MVKKFKERQNELNRDIGRSAGAGRKGDANQEIAKDQEGLRRDLEGLRDKWYDESGSLDKVGSLDRAGDEMKEAAEDLRRDSPRDAQPHGDLASEALGLAISEVESAMAALAAEMVEQLQSGASGLAKEQRELGMKQRVRQKAKAKN